MQRLNKHIALFLLLVFAFPVAYQSVHVLHHQGEKHVAECCEHYDLHSYSDNGFNFNSKESTEKCPICEYEFTTCEFYGQLNWFVDLQPIANKFIQCYSSKYIGYNGSDCSLRAPPFIV